MTSRFLAHLLSRLWLVLGDTSLIHLHPETASLEAKLFLTWDTLIRDGFSLLLQRLAFARLVVLTDLVVSIDYPGRVPARIVLSITSLVDSSAFCS